MSNTTTKHTPTPWYVEKATTMNFAHILDEGSRDLVASATPRHAVGSIDIDAGDANAQFIARACNAHESNLEKIAALVEALEALITAADELAETNFWDPVVIEQARAALAEAKEQTS